MSAFLSGHRKTLNTILAHPLNQGRALGALGDYLAWNIGRRLLRADYVLPLDDACDLIVSNRQNYATLLYTCRLWDFEEMCFLLHLLRPEDLFVDIGANVGAYTVLAAKQAGARAIGFEPVPSTYDEFRRNIALNGIENRAEARQLGLGETPVTMKMTADRGGLNRVVVAGFEGRTVEVEIKRLDDVLPATGCRLIKMDAEGYEMNILRGARATFSNPSLAGLIVELNGSGEAYGHSDASVHAEIVGYGFQPYRYNPSVRQLIALGGYGRDGMNTIYVRDAAAISAILAAGKPITVRNQLI